MPRNNSNQQKDSKDPGHTAGTAEGNEKTVNEALKSPKKKNQK